MHQPEQITKKPLFENIRPTFGNSFTVRKFTEEDANGMPYWHCHPEYEIVFISNGRGRRHIADHVSHYFEGDLILLGPNLPHLGFTQETKEQHVQVVVQMKEDFLGKDFFEIPEMADIRQLFERARSGLSFHGHTRWEVGQILQNMVDLDKFWRMVELLRALQIMADSQEVWPLKINYLSLEVKPHDQQRMQSVYHFVEQNFQKQFTLDEASQVINMTPPAFCRFFKKLNHKTFIEFVNEFRVAHACSLLSEEHLSIAAVSYESGFNNLSHFNKQFKIVTGVTPTQYRQDLRKVVVSTLK
jgi:AraC-like DNA-binding protein/quercetin dioxygenase-like cupin family protein